MLFGSRVTKTFGELFSKCHVWKKLQQTTESSAHHSQFSEAHISKSKCLNGQIKIKVHGKEVYCM